MNIVTGIKREPMRKKLPNSWSDCHRTCALSENALTH